MAKAKVYFSKVWDEASGTHQLHPLKGTTEAIALWGGIVVPETEEEVEEDQLDAQGRYDPAKGDALDDALAPEQVAEKPPTPAP